MTQRDAPERQSAPVVLVSLRGAPGEAMRRHLATGVVARDGALGEAARTGASTFALEPVTASFTSTSTASLLTGSRPGTHGVVNNTFFLRTGGRGSGFDYPLDAETLIEAATRQHKTVIDLSPILSLPRERAARYTLLPGEQVNEPAIVELRPGSTIQPRTRWLEHARRVNPSPDSLRFAGEQFVSSVIDTTHDGRVRWEALLLDADTDPSNGYLAALAPGQWAPIAVRASNAGGWVKLLTPLDGTGPIRLYVAGFHRNAGWPADFVRLIDDSVGFWPGYPDIESYRRGSIDAQTLMEAAERLSDFKRRVAIRAVALPFDLLLLDENIVDNVSHNFLLTHPSQSGFHDAARRLQFARYIEDAYRIADRNLTALQAAIPANAAFAVVAPYGMTATHSAIDLQAILERALRADRDAADVRVAAYGPHAHLYIADRAATSAVIARLSRRLNDERGPDGRPLFLQVFDRHSARAAGLAHRVTTGDIVLVAREGSVIVHADDHLRRPLEPRFPADHGYPPSVTRMHGFLLVGGDGVSHASLPGARLIDIAATVASLLRIEPPTQSEGRALPLRVASTRTRPRANGNVR